MVEKAQKAKRRKILVTGSSGMLGTALCGELSGAYDVAGLDIRIGCDITDRKKTSEIVGKTKPDLIIHAAAWTDVDGCEKDPDKTEKININGTENIAHSAATSDIPLIYISTDFVFDGRKKTPYAEEDAPNPINVYARSKLEGEKRVSALNKYIILRTSWLYGDNGKNFVRAILGKAKSEKKLRVVDDQVGSPTYAKDLAGAISKLLTVTLRRTMDERRWTKEVYHVSNKGVVSWFDYAKEILRLAGIKGVSVIPIKSSELKRPAKRPAFSALDNSKFEEATNFKMRPWDVALAEYLNEKR